MITISRLTKMSLTLGAFALIGLLFSHLALTDIYKNNEPNLNTEWGIVRASFIITFMFIVLSSITLLRFIKNKTNEH